MSEWKGLWKCEICKLVFRQKDYPARLTMCPECGDKLIPHDRRAPDPRVAALVEALDAAVLYRHAYDNGTIIGARDRADANAAINAALEEGGSREG